MTGRGDGEVSDQALIASVRAGDLAAYARLIDRYQHRLFALTWMILRDRFAAEEVVQDAFLRAYTRLSLYDDSRSWYPWLASIGVRLAQNRLRGHRKMATVEGVSIESTAEPLVPALGLEGLLTEERSNDIWQAVSRLPKGPRLAVLLHYRDEMPVRRAARVLGVTDGTVKTWLFRARIQLRRLLREQPKAESTK